MDLITTNEIAYLCGLITGRGHFFPESKVIAIEFSHTNETIVGIAHCKSCGYLVTKTPGGSSYKCKSSSCGKTYVEEELTRKTYNQPKSTIDSLNNIIIPLLRTKIHCQYQIIGNYSMTLLLLDFKGDSATFSQIHSYFEGQLSFDKFRIPNAIKDSNNSIIKIEFINGLLDTAGFNNSGGWLPRDGLNNHGRMRSYFQIVRNWYLPVEIDNFIRDNFNLSTQTIDWGHPNIRDGNLRDYYNSSQTSWSREHQVKFFPEYFKQFKYRIKHKQELFEELIEHNENADFGTETEDWFPPTTVTPKAYHPGEADPRIPEPVRKHFDAFWQVNYALGCKYLHDYVDKLDNPEIFLITGKNIVDDIDKVKEEWDKERHSLTNDAIRKYASARTTESTINTNRRSVRTTPEQALYSPIKEHLKEYLRNNYGKEPIVYDTSSFNLNQFIRINNKELLDIFNYCEEYRIKPDVVGFITENKHLFFVEVKATNLNLENLGQLIGYCMVAQPEEAILIADKPLATSFVKAIKAVPEILYYNESNKVKIAEWTNNEFKFLEI